LWTAHVTAEHEAVCRDIKSCGYDGVEIPMFEGTPDHYARIGEMLDRVGLERTVVSVIGPSGKNPLSAVAAERKAAVDYARWAIDCTAALGSPILSGPLHSEYGTFSGVAPTAAERKRAISFHRKAGDYAARRNMRIALEALNRFEVYFLNTAEQLAAYVDEVDHPNIRAMFDTFHANIEEKDPVGAIKTLGKRIIHVHISENDRGTPGKGHVPWEATYKALRKLKYDGWLTIESFSRALPALAAATRVWRDFAVSRDSVYKDGFRCIRNGWAKAGR
jgi:D-psicose/D-tagatose/L-ribulose 3-epimerase